jgi:hypothetical protein
MKRLLCALGLSISSLSSAQVPAAASTLALDTPASALFDISGTGEAALQAVKAELSARGVWWTELEAHLFVYGNSDQLDQLANKLPLAHALGDLPPAAFALQARGCAERPELLLPAIAMAGRYALVRQPRAFAPTRYSAEYLPLRDQSTVARASANVSQANRLKGSDPLAQFMADQINPARWFADVTTLASFDRSSFSPSLINARDWIGAQFSQLNLSVSYPSFSFTSGGQTVTSSNVLGVYTGAGAPGDWILVGGHYDSRNSSLSSASMTPGAEDNASGCAGVIELARIITTVRPNRSVLFMCYSGEEQGLHGSRAHVTALQNSGDINRLKFFLIMDMIGYSSDADLDVLLESNIAGQPVLDVFAAAAAQYEPRLRVLQSNSPFGSDHIPYLSAGLPGLLTIENDWNVYPHYHRTTDTPANMSNALDMGGAILRMNAAAMAGYLGGAIFDPADAVFQSGFE